MKSDELSITWNTIDVSIDLDLSDDLVLRWQRDHDNTARSVVGTPVTTVEATTWQGMVGRRRPKRSYSVTYGRWFGT